METENRLEKEGKMVGLILAAGYATRLYPITLTKSKCLLDVAGKPMIEYVVEKLLPIEQISKIYIVVNNKFYKDFNVWLNNFINNKNQKDIELINDGSTDDSNKLGAIGDINFVIKNKNIADDLIIVAGDNLFTDSIAGFIREAEEKNKPLLGIYELGSLENVHKYSAVTIDSEGKLISFVEKPSNPTSSKIGIALYYYPKSFLRFFEEYAKEGKNQDQPGRFIQWLYLKKEIYTYEIKGKWFDIGDLKVLQEAENFLKTGQFVSKSA